MPTTRDREQRVLAVGDVEAGEQHRRLAGDRDAGALQQHQHEDARQPEVADDVRRRSRRAVRDRGEDEDGVDRDGGQGTVPRRRGRPLCSTPQTPLRAPARRARRRARTGARRGRFILGPEVEAFEREFAAYARRRARVGVANGTEAITIALRALGVGPGDEVVVPSFTFYAAPRRSRRPARPPCSATSTRRRSSSTPDDRAGRAHAAHEGRDRSSHLFGNVAPVAEIEALGVPVLEDAAQATGSRLRGELTGGAGHDRDVLLLPVEEPRRPRRRRRDRDRRRRAGRARAHAALPRLAATR